MEDFNVRQSIQYMRAARAVDHLYFTLVIFTYILAGPREALIPLCSSQQGRSSAPSKSLACTTTTTILVIKPHLF